MNIITLTMNPAFDVHCYAKEFVAEKENLVAVTSREAGGKGINLSRALVALGCPVTPFVVLGSENAEEFRALLSRDKLHAHELTVPGRIRENITVHAEKAPETRISFAGLTADPSLTEQLERLLPIESDTVVTVTGRSPDGLDEQQLCDFLLRLKKRGAALVIDSRSASLATLAAVRPWLIKPNAEEIAAYVGYAPKTPPEFAAAAHSLYQKGIANVMLSMGADGACLVCRDGAFWAKPPVIRPLSTIGAGDSSIAGFLTAVSKGNNAPSCLRWAVAAGSAACLTEGTHPPRVEDVARLLAEVKLQKL